MEPTALKKMMLLMFKAGILDHSYLSWDGGGGGFYAQGPFSGMEMVMRYMDTAGDQDCLGWDTGGGVTILQKLIETGLEMNRTFAKGRSDGLLDVGAGTGKMLEIEEDDYQHVIGAVNTMAVNYYHTLARWCADQKNSSCVDTFKSLGENLNGIDFLHFLYREISRFCPQNVLSYAAQVNAKLWDDDLGWYGNMYPGEDEPRTVLSYHTLEALRSFGPGRFAAAVRTPQL